MDLPANPCKAPVTHRLFARGSLLGVDSGGIVGAAAGNPLLFAAPRLRLAALEVVAQRGRQTPLRGLFFLLFHLLAHTDRLRLRQPYGKDRAGFGALRARVGTLNFGAAQCCRSSVVEHPLGKGEVVSSILTGSTSY
jgi:hypothetical protein